MEIKRKCYREQCEEFSSNVKNEMLDKYNSWHSLFKRAEPYKYLILNIRHTEHYTDQGHVVGRLFTELNTANQPSETDQSVLGSDHHYFQLEGLRWLLPHKLRWARWPNGRRKTKHVPQQSHIIPSCTRYRWFKVYPDEHYESKPVNREKPETNFVHAYLFIVSSCL